MFMQQNVIDYYNANVQQEWNRLDKCFVENYIVQNYLDSYIRKNSSVLDLGGGPGHFSLYLCQKGNSVLLVDIAKNNIDFANQQARKLNCSLKTLVGDACNIENIVHKKYDCILLMGPIYHLIDEQDRINTIHQCINLLKNSGVLFISFISSYSRILYALREKPNEILDNPILINDILQNTKEECIYRKNPDKFLIPPNQVEIFMKQFKQLQKLQIVGCESILGPHLNLMSQLNLETQKKWLEFALMISNKETAIYHSEHIMYIGQKNEI